MGARTEVIAENVSVYTGNRAGALWGRKDRQTSIGKVGSREFR
jgi:hypothetical protein